jgi:cystathionine beta-lyase/cystathionine gamma-synthase
LRPPRLLAQELGFALVVDSSLASPINVRPVEHGADVVIHSGEAWLLDDDQAHAGVVCGAQGVIDEVRDKMALWGHAHHTEAVAALDRGLRTLPLRVARQNRSAAQIAELAAAHPRVRRVLYPGHASHPDFNTASTIFDGFGGTMLVDLDMDEAAAEHAVSRLRCFEHSPRVGGVRSRAHVLGERWREAATSESIRALALGDGVVRLCIGLEDAGDLLADLAQSLE